jgi:hypothetical protein
MDLYGYGWDYLDNIPPHWAFLKPQIQSAWKGTVGDKLEALSKYKYAYCYENAKEPGYLTEKLIHCLIAGAQPIYMGAVDPKDIDLKKHSYQSFAGQLMELLG